MPINRISELPTVGGLGGVNHGGEGGAQPQIIQPVVELIMPQATSGNVPAFLAKLWKMVENPETDLMITWTDSGNSFIIKNQAEFSRDLLPYYYKHSNMASFIRQLNMYGFHKVVSVDSGGLKGDRDEIEFAHPFFLRGQEHLLPEIKRKVSSMVGRQAVAQTGGGGGGGTPYIPNIKSDKVNEVLTEVNLLKDRQEDTDTKLDTMRKENEALWQEVLNLRQKHSQQQKVVNKLIQFLMAVVQPRMTTGIKRRYVPGSQLAIDSPSFKAKEPKISSTERPEGPIIQDVTHTMVESPSASVNPATDPLMSLLEAQRGASSPLVLDSVVSPAASVRSGGGGSGMFSPKVEMPATPRSVDVTDIIDDPPVKTSQDKYRLVNPAAVNSAIVQGSAVRNQAASQSLPAEKRPALNREISKEDFDLDITNMQAELDNLKDILSGQITLDTSLVSSLFSPEDAAASMPSYNYANLPNNITINAEGLDDLHNDDLKSLSYNPSLFELTAEDEDTDSLIPGLAVAAAAAGGSSMPPPTSAAANPRMSSDLSTPLPPSSELNTPLVSEDTTNPLSKI